MSKTYEEWLKYYENATKKQVIEDVEHDNLEIERLNSIINNDFSKICREKMIDKLSANEMILLQNKEIERLHSIIEKIREKLLCYGETFDLKIHQDMQKELLEITDKVDDNG